MRFLGAKAVFQRHSDEGSAIFTRRSPLAELNEFEVSRAELEAARLDSSVAQRLRVDLGVVRKEAQKARNFPMP